jgi:hypothetical protein
MYKILVLIFFLFTFSINANDTTNLSSFGVLGLTLSDSERYGYRPSIGSDKGVYKGDIDFLSRSLIGFQVDSTLSDDLDVVAQVTLKDVPKSNLNSYVSLAFLRYSPSSNWSFRVGRTAPDLFLVTEFRNVNFSYNWASVPTEVYGVIPYRHIDGLDVDYTTRYLDGTLSTKIFTGQSYADIPTTFSIEKIKIENVIGFSTKFEKDDWVLQARHSRVTIANEGEANKLLLGGIGQIPTAIWPDSNEFAKNLILKGSQLQFYSIGFQKYIDRWLFSAEASQVTADSEIIPQITSGYGSLAYQNNQHTFYGLGAVVQADNYMFKDEVINQGNFPELVSSIEQVGNFYAFNQRSLSLGWRWDISSVVSSTLQFTQTHIEDNGGTLWVIDTNNNSKDTVNTVFINLSWAL